ncbi:hypothetical protein BDD12DRAFT_860737 [Trichophaea hybrida]|nr:hypothetical protein BDD12DRAFT_860737 [Trichophaea hybrida]
MSLSHLSTELLYEVVDYLADPCDIKALLRVNHHFHAVLSNVFAQRFDHLAGGSANIRDYRRKNLNNWRDYVSDTALFEGSRRSNAVNSHTKDIITFSNDPSVLASHQRYLEYCNLAYIGTLHGWNRLVKALVRTRGVPGNATVLIPPVRPRGKYYMFRGAISIIVEAAERNNIDLVRFLLEEANTDVDSWSGPTSSGASDYRTSLQAACRYGHAGIVALLLNHRADVHGPCADGGHPELL